MDVFLIMEASIIRRLGSRILLLLLIIPLKQIFIPYTHLLITFAEIIALKLLVNDIYLRRTASFKVLLDLLFVSDPDPKPDPENLECRISIFESVHHFRLTILFSAVFAHLYFSVFREHRRPSRSFHTMVRVTFLYFSN
jgi:hypothetical protein